MVTPHAGARVNRRIYHKFRANYNAPKLTSLQGDLRSPLHGKSRSSGWPHHVALNQAKAQYAKLRQCNDIVVTIDNRRYHK